MSAESIIKFYEEHPNVKYKDIAHKFNVSPQYVGRILKDVANNKSDYIVQVKRMYFEERLSITNIYERLEESISMPTIRKILRSNQKEFIEEKERRKQETRQRNKQVKKSRSSEDVLEDIKIMAALEHMQKVCAIEDSRSSKLTSRDLILMNRQHYEYNCKKDRYELKNLGCAIPAGLPKILKITGYISASEPVGPGEFYTK